MKKYFLLPLLVVLVPEFAFGASARYTQLVREKQRKMEQLEKCMGTTKGLKIAGVSTLGLTAVGVAGNIAEAKIISDNTKIIDKKNKEIETAQKELEEKRATIDKNRLAREEAAKKQQEQEGQPKTFQEACEFLDGTYTKEPLVYTGTNISASIALFDGCKFGTDEGIDENCNYLVKYKTKGNLYIDRDKIICAFVGNADFQCLEDNDPNCWARREEAAQNKDGEPCDAAWLAQQNATKGVYHIAEGETELSCFIQECKSGYHATLKGKDYDIATTGINNEVVCEKDGSNNQVKDETNPDKTICENSENGGTWMGTICYCGAEKFWNPKNKKCEKTENESDNKDCLSEIKKSEQFAQSAQKNSSGECEILTCSGGKIPSNDKKSCIYPNMLEEITVTPNKPKIGDACTPEDTNATAGHYVNVGGGNVKCAAKECKAGYEIAKNAAGAPQGWCKKKITQPVVEPVVKKENKVEENKESNLESVSIFSGVKVNLEQGKILAELYGEKYNKSLSFITGSEKINTGGQDYISYKYNNTIYTFEFDSLTGGTDYTPVLDVMCKMYSGTGTKHIGNGKIMCQGIQLNLCDHMGRSIRKVIPGVSAGKYHDGITEVCVFSK